MTTRSKFDHEMRLQMAQEHLVRKLEIEACAFCQENKGQMAPRHFASPRCESGKRNHCTCDVCF